MDFNSQNSLTSLVAREFWELKFTCLKVARFEKVVKMKIMMAIYTYVYKCHGDNETYSKESRLNVYLRVEPYFYSTKYIIEL